MEQTVYLSTGELAQMLDISKQTVIYYDRVGLLSPAGRGSQNYRLYTLDQADELDTILTLRNLGVPIEELKDYLRRKSPAHCIEMLRRQEAFAEFEIKRMERLRRKISGRAAILEQVLKETDYEQVAYASHQRCDFLFEASGDSSEKEQLQSFIRLCKRAQELQIDFENPVCGIIPKGDLIGGEDPHLAGYAILLPPESTPPPHSLPTLVRPSGWYATGYHRGPGKRLPDTYRRITEQIRRDGWQICGDGYEEDLFSILTNADPEDYLRRIIIPVEKKQDDGTLPALP